jgi:dienelactone hydrolase
VGAIRWPGPGHDLHGFMAIPAKAHGRQPAVLVLPEAGADRFALDLTDALALAGFVACVAKEPLSLDEALASLHWLGTNAYATGKVAAVGTGAGAALVERIAATRASPLTCAVAFDGRTASDGYPHILHLAPLTAVDQAGDYAGRWREAMDFLARNLAMTVQR